MPIGVAGLIIAAVFAAAMSSLDSSLNSMSAVVLTDFYRRFKRKVDERQALLLARILTVAFGILGTAMAYAMYKSNIDALWQHYMKIIGLFGGGLAGVFALGMFTRRATGAGALVGALVAAVVLLCIQRYTDVSFLLYSSIGICTRLHRRLRRQLDHARPRRHKRPANRRRAIALLHLPAGRLLIGTAYDSSASSGTRACTSTSSLTSE